MISLDESEWIDMDEVLGTPWRLITLELFKPAGMAVGVEFKNKKVEGRPRECVYVENMSRNSPFAAGGLQLGDLIVSIEAVRIIDYKQAAKVLSKSGEQVVMTIERKSDFKWDKKTALLAPPPQDADETSMQGSGRKASTASERATKRGDSAAILQRAKQRGFPIKRTTYVLSNREPVFLESFTFDIKNHYRYINVGVWSKGQILSLQGVKKPRIDTMLGYTSIPVSHVLEECLKTTEGYHGEVVKLLCPNFTYVPKEFHKYATLAGFDPRLCYGDITLRFLFKGEYKVKGTQLSFEVGRAPKDAEEEGAFGPADTARAASVSAKSLQHDFEEVLLKKGTLCKYCTARIWLNSGMRCKVCRMIIHRRCFEKTRARTLCKQKMWPDEYAVPIARGPQATAKEEQEMRLLENEVKAALPATAANAKTPKSLSTGAAAADDAFFKRLELTDNASGLENVLQGLAARGYGMETFAEAVKAAKKIHGDLEPQARVDRVRNVYQIVKGAFESERERKDKLGAQLSTAADEATRQELRQSYEASELRLKGLNLVLLYYASGLKHLYEEHDEGSERTEGNVAPAT
ncbi:uncharacterized protein LOC144175193 [Haemaphysalis longicornis]